ncbi:MAG: glutaredoxin domain-containing protein [Candidatus Marinimicrobia bacterium]|nr:glutaredoxin domain-containing protein [Candidatus Neomarinimicrobiota bacterium]MDD5583062.1 glutaredoxin domain-containing protein [Candidatus Neomarinimicrobiota bacterium]
MEQKRVIVFTTPTCTYCYQVKRYLTEQGIRFKEVDVSLNTKAADDMFRKSGQKGVPQLWINNRPIVGFDRPKIDKLLNLKK